MTKPYDTDGHSLLADEAAEWFVRLDAKSVSEEDRRAFESWRAQSPAHQQAFDEITRLWRTFDRLPEKPTSQPSPVPWGARLRGSDERSRRGWLLGGVACAAVLLLIVLTTDVLTLTFADYRVGVGEMRAVLLTDGSTMQLNTATAVDIDISSTRRRVTLLKGEALFTVTPDAQRPFQVVAQGGVSTALGTEFSVRRQADTVTVTVLESRVSVAYAKESGSRATPTNVILSPGQQVRYNVTTGLGPLETVDLFTAVAWRRGKIIFENQPLGEVIDELNRYHSGRIQIIDPQVRELRVNGVFETADPAGVIDALERSLPLRSTRLTNWLILIHR